MNESMRRQFLRDYAQEVGRERRKQRIVRFVREWYWLPVSFILVWILWASK